jgi:hypothetical protein
MTLSTASYFTDDTDVQVRAEAQAEYGWKEVSKGLYGILLAHGLMIGSLAFAVAAIVCMALEMEGATPAEKEAGPSMILMLLVGVAGIVVLCSYGMVIRSMWRCLMHAPERNHARWLMFASILCILMGPALNFCAGFFGGGDPVQQVREDEVREASGKFGRMGGYTKALSVTRTDGCLRLAGSAIGLLSTLFFGMFLRATALSFEQPLRARLAEGYLLFTLVLAGVSFTLFQNPLQVLASPELLLALVAGALVSFLWYLLLVACVAVGITTGLHEWNLRRKALLEEPLAQPLAQPLGE